MIGKVLNSRYELVEKVGTGGMAIVYRSKDQLLGREVAVKILQPHFADNETAVRRFKHEAQAVASLSHPNIVNIFDIGKEDDINYIVMEYITGKDLKEHLKEVERIEIDQAIKIVTGVCNALIKAHRNNIVHCDVKPHNILLTDDGRVKVTDFGIAQAVTSATMGQTDSIMGSAHYLSPEQAKGGKVSTKSDIYSLGVVLYELVTGSVPFTGDNHVSIALKHIEESPEDPKKINSQLPDRLAEIILKAIAKEPENRYNSVVELLRDLKEVEEDIANQAKEVKSIANQHTMIMSKQDYQKEIKKEKEKNNTNIIKKEEVQQKLRGVDVVEEKKNKEPTSKKKVPAKKRSGLLTALLILAASFIVIMGVGYFMLVQYVNVEEVKVPNLVGKHLEVARQDLESKGLSLKVYYESYSQEIEKDHIISQSIPPNNKVKKARVIEVVVSKGAQVSKVPELLNITLREAEIKLDKLDLQKGEIKEEYSNEVAEGQIISQDPQPGIEVKAGTDINLVISKGREPQEVEVPNLVGLRQEEAVERLRQLNLILGQVLKRESLDYHQGRVIAQKPSTGTKIMEGSTIQLIISTGIRNPRGSEIKDRKIRFNIPPGNEKRVEFVVQDDNGQRTVYDQIHQAGDTVVKDVIIVGPGTIRIYLDGQLYYEKQV
ncbi:serine/threonine-protein kinase [Orenia metallireducens]|uniref:non-specific serine/threonine protein kinase n=1 Tax=Orenia metallireducens TaxID=1413210 RepID=A0A285FG08_9FIRM|nr:Stk1 family PASTA domain-containing Ser/Thr kinase [Orenia metallireducens]PRX33528.1 serine/threonine-protein kinase [Orenia metallireducens]SNY10205.1 serine/threonine protein kinase [Orenia metallireducens]